MVRHPIADGRNNVVGYDLRFGGAVDLGNPAMDAKATSALLVEAFGDIGLERLAGRHPAWVAIARNFLVEIGPPPVRPDRAVLEIAAYPAKDDLLGVLQRLGRSGYTIALEGFDGRTDLGDLMALCSIVRVDVAAIPEEDLPRLIEVPRLQGALLVATSVPDHAAFERCRQLGFTYFQGEYFSKPRLFKHRGVATSGLTALRQLGELTGRDVCFEDLERIIGSDVGLSLKLLRYVNSAYFALPRTVGSVREALMLLGERTIRRWVTVMVVSSIPDVPDELLTLALRRARMCETLAGPAASSEERERLFTIGLFSVADALLDAPMAEVLDSLPFAEEIQAALLRREGPKGELLSAVLAYEHGEFPELGTPTGAPSLAAAYRAALEWSEEAGRSVR